MLRGTTTEWPLLSLTMSTTEPSLVAEGLRKEFGTVTALDGVDLAVGGPQILGVAGPNGSGKTTLIHCLLGLLTPTAGDARVAGTRPASFDAADRRRLGYMPQHTAVYDDLTVRENVAFFAKLYGVDDRSAAVDRALSFVDLADRANSRIDELSGGMVRRTSLACAMVHDPEVVFLDEPTVGSTPGCGRRCGRASTSAATRARSSSSRPTTWARSPTATGCSSCARGGSSRTIPPTPSSNRRRPGRWRRPSSRSSTRRVRAVVEIIGTVSTSPTRRR
jgi:ABC-2 type transport system ATP-binding protein